MVLDSQGPNNGSAFSDDASIGSIEWNNPSNAQTSNDIYATATVTSGSTTHYLKCKGFGFTLPAAVILGIRVDLEAKQSVVIANWIESVKLLKAGVIGGADRSDQWALPTSDGFHYYGSDGDLWERAWTPADINSSEFGCVIAVKNWAGSTSTASIDHVTVTVYYYPVKEFSDVGAGLDSIESVTARLTISDLSQAVESVLSPILVLLQDSAASLESVLSPILVLLQDSAASLESVLSPIPVLCQDSGLLSDMPEIEVLLSMVDSIAGTESLGIDYAVPMTDAVVGIEVFSALVTGTHILDSCFGVDISHRVQDTITLDDYALPGILQILIDEPTTIDEGLYGTSDELLPRRTQVGKQGRTVSIDGLASPAECEVIRQLADGTSRTLYLLTGDSFLCLVSGAEFEPKVGEEKFLYHLMIHERMAD